MQTQTIELRPAIKGVNLSPVHEKCTGCAKMTVFEGFDGYYCRVYANPTALWRRGCVVATHVINNNGKEQGKKRVGQQKQGKKKTVGKI